MGFVILSVSLLILAAGVGLGIVTLGRNRGSAWEILNQRMASGEIGVEEYRERLSALGRSTTGSEWVPAAILIALALAGSFRGSCHRQGVRVLASRDQAEAGETVNLALENLGEAFHTLTIEEIDFQIGSEAGRRSSGALTVDRSGSFSVTCSVPGHADAGMRATLVVE